MDAVQYAKQKKIKINKEILFASYANLPITDYTSHPPKVSLEQYPFIQGEKAMEMMIDILNQHEPDNNTGSNANDEIIPATLIAR
jgi:DNA-binding LacI/PurR family transcriptional regulator